MTKIVNEAEVRRLLRPLAGEPETDPRIDVAETMRRGAQLRRRHQAVTSAAYAAVLGLTIAGGVVMLPLGNREPAAEPMASGSATTGWNAGLFPPSGAPIAPEGTGCAVSDFPVRDAQLYRTDRSGRWSVTGRAYSTGDLPPSIFRDGVPAGNVTVPDQYAVVTAINTAGEAAMTSEGDQTRPWALVNGVSTPLPGGAGTATAINDSGRLGGTLDNGARPVVWDGPAASPADLPMPDGFDRAVVVGIGNDGTVVGAVSSDLDNRAAMVLWLPGGARRVVSHASEGVEQIRPVAAGDGWVVGRESTGLGFRYDIAADRYETLPGQLAAPVAVTANGAVAGLAAQSDGNDYGQGAYVLLGDEVRPLEGIDGATATHISGITEDGHTVFGNIETTDGTYRAVTWSC
ncbi:hypothetical protein ACIA8K_36685 [Catenuloplanes sp. NPDC051500]|uniref:hypothetical protein n=1 Tax=Catenuloplanes sp. NPDC051500 TaxID=3363959 RepID=UPI0037AFECE0